jgi:putative ABC transport system permease protein
MDSILRDLKQALRVLGASPGISFAALTSIALGVGGTTAMFSVVYGILMRPLPYPEPRQLVGMWEVHPGANAPLKQDLLSRPTYRAWAETSSTLQSIASYSAGDFSLTNSGATERVRGARVTPSLFGVLRAVPGRGRFLTATDAETGAAPVVVIGDSFWRDHFGRDPSAVGKTLEIDDVNRVIVGVAREGLAFPEADIVLYVPLIVPRTDPADQAIGVMTAIARLKPGASVAQAEAEGTAYARAALRPFAEIIFGSGAPVEVRVRPLVDQETRNIRQALLVLAAGIGLLLLIACANVTNLLLSRASDRVREFAVRAALGAGRGRILRQLVIESLVVATAGGLLGVTLGWLLTSAVPTLAPDSVPRLYEIRVDGGFLVAAILASTFVGLVAGVWPAFASAKVDLLSAMQQGGTRSTGASGKQTRRLLVVAEAALAVVLLVGAALLGRSYSALMQVDAGYQVDHVLTADLIVPRSFKPHQTAQLATSLVEHVQTAPGIRAVAVGSMAPFGGALYSSGFALPGLTTPDGKPLVVRALQAVVTPRYAEALGLRLKEGRFLTAHDTSPTAIAMVVNETFARMYFTDGRLASGRLFAGMFPKMLGRTDAVVTIVGVVEDVLPDRLDGLPQPQIYLPMGLGFERRLSTIVVRTDGDPALAGPLVRRAVLELEPNARVEQIGPLEAKRFNSSREPRFTALVLGLFATLAVSLAMTGLYGVLSHSVSQRRRELAVRGALGATKMNLLTMILREGIAMVTIGILLGGAAAMVLTRGMSSLLFGVKPLDPLAFGLATTLLLAVAAAASVIPAARAARVEAAEALKAE